MNTNRSIIFLVGVLISIGHCASAAQSMRIVTGGASTTKALTERKAELEKVAGEPVEIVTSSSFNGIAALSRGMVDAITSGFDLRAAIADATKKGSSSLNADDFDVTEFLRVDLKVGVHPDNSVQNLTDAQLTDILSGKTKSWRAISGQDIPIQLIIAKNYVAIDKLISDHFLHGQKSPVAQYVLDKEGMFKGVQGNKGAIGFFSLKESLAGFTPKFLPTSISHSSYFIIRKDARPPVRKVFELVRGETKTDK